jgi:uncharacterized protein with beta-barrel porin domain
MSTDLPSGFPMLQQASRSRRAGAMPTLRCPPAAPAASTFEQRWRVWAAGFGGSQSTDGNAALGVNNRSSSLAGSAVGADYRLSADTLAGFALVGGGTCVYREPYPR